RFACDSAGNPCDHVPGARRVIFVVPDDALLATDVAATVIEYLPEPDADETWELRSSVTRTRSNLLRMLGRLEEALESAIGSEVLAAAFATGGYAYAQARQTRGLALFALQRYEEALSIAREAAGRFSEFGDRRRISHARMLEAACLLEQGRIDEAKRVNAEIMQLLDKLNDRRTSAHMAANLGVMSLRMNDTISARRSTEEARRLFQELSMETEIIRTDWILAVIDLRDGAAGTNAIARLETAADAFAELKMVDDSATVRITILEQMVAEQRWEDAARLASDLVATFLQTGARVDLANAVFILRNAISRRQATPEMVRSIGVHLPAFVPIGPKPTIN
ncbi:MAG TPA: hypothetical protein VJ032_13290, partial [Thermoanaerobaculia bacterium]|nr:hypothetical protein [Thermoanaerobaculia bacterium]